MRLSQILLAVGCLALGFGSFAAQAQRSAASVLDPKSPPQPGAMTLHVTTRLTLVDVTVTDSKGHAVHALKQSDFTILEDGKPQPIRNFQEVDAELPTPRRPARLTRSR